MNFKSIHKEHSQAVSFNFVSQKKDLMQCRVTKNLYEFFKTGVRFTGFLFNKQIPCSCVSVPSVSLMFLSHFDVICHL